MEVSISPFTVHKRVALTISRGTHAQSTNLWVRILADDIEGWGEATAFSVGYQTQSTDQLTSELTAIAPQLAAFHPLERQQLAPLLAKLSAAARAAIDVALHDWLGKRVGLPLWRLWGLNREAIGPTAATIGISAPPQAVERLHQWRSAIPDLQSIKVKLGNPQGIEADKAMMTALLAELTSTVKVSIDANGGWNLETATEMATWLADRGIAYLEQPLPVALDDQLGTLAARSPLPIYVDESCFTAADIPRLANTIQGINIKLMKAGGLSEAWKMIYTARACGLKVMFGCYSDSSLANTALAHLAPLADHLDLDSHLNLVDDPFLGAELRSGCLIPNDSPGLGITQDDLSHC